VRAIASSTCRTTISSKVRGIHYAATWIEGNLCSDEEVIVVGGGNTAGQAAVFLSGLARHVHMMVRSEDLAATMSDYLIQRIEASPRSRSTPTPRSPLWKATPGWSR
jgi:thioredoxin reductase